MQSLQPAAPGNCTLTKWKPKNYWPWPLPGTHLGITLWPPHTETGSSQVFDRAAGSGSGDTNGSEVCLY